MIHIHELCTILSPMQFVRVDPLQYANSLKSFLFATLSSLAIPSNKKIYKTFFILNSRLGENRIGFTRIRDQFACTQERKTERRRHIFHFSPCSSHKIIRKSAITRHEKWEKCCARGAHRNEIFMDHDISFHAILQPYHESFATMILTS